MREMLHIPYQPSQRQRIIANVGEVIVQSEPLTVQQGHGGQTNAVNHSRMPSISSGSIRSGSRRSRASTSSRRELERAEQLAQINEQARQNQLRIQRAEAEAEEKRLEEQRRLLELRFLALVGEDEEDDRRSNILSNASRIPDVEKWIEDHVEHYHQTADDELVNYHQDNLPTPANTVNVPHPMFVDRPHITHTEAQARNQGSADDNIVKLAESITTAMTSALQVARPNGDMSKFVARQSGAKDLPEFHGNPEEWPTFIGRFQSSTNMCGFSNEENIIRLQKCLKGKAKDCVVAMLSSACNVNDVMEVLKKRFGRPDQIIKRMIEKAKNVSPPSDGDFQSLLDFSIVVKNVCSMAESLKLPMYLNNPSLVEEFRRKLPSHLQLEWGKHMFRTGKDADLKELSSYLDEISSAAVFVCDSPGFQSKNKRSRDPLLVVTDTSCPLKCKDAHLLSSCPKFKKMKNRDRWDCVKKLRVCFCCLEKGHSRPNCPNLRQCGKDGCATEHHVLLHYQVKKNKEEAEMYTVWDKKREAPTKDENTIGVIADWIPLGKVIMRVVPVWLVGPKGSILVNAFLDGGAGLTIVDQKIAIALGLEGECKALYLNWLGGRKEKDDKSQLVSLKIRGVNETEEHDLIDVRTKENLLLPVVPLSNYKLLKKWKHLQDIPFPEPLKDRPMIIIGEDHAHLLLERKHVEGARNAPIASWSYLGWVVHGNSKNRSGFSNEAAHVSMVSMEGRPPDEILHEMVKEQFRLDSLGIINCTKLPQSKDNCRALELMESKSRRIGDSWETCLLWKTEDMTLPLSIGAATRRLKILEKQMDRDPRFADSYCGKIDEYLSKEFCRKLTKEETAADNGRVWYLPHFGTTNPNKPGKVRLVFDCAARVNGMSLNDALLQGPDLMSPLINVLLKFRQREIAFCGDIRDMFHMVKIRSEDLPALRFLWRGKDRSRPPDVYTMDVMVFGAVSSPFQAQWIKNRNADDFQADFPTAVDAIHNKHYVDDYLDSTENSAQAIQRINEVKEIHRRGGFEIRGWLCNDPDVLSAVAPDEVKQKVMLNAKEEVKLEKDMLSATNEVKLERVLGLFWEPTSDVFKFKVTFRNVNPAIVAGEKTPTKRELLKLLMSLYDPLGFIGHLTVRGRMLLQDVWKSGIGWDMELQPELKPKWIVLLQQIMRIPEAEIRRCYAVSISKAVEIQLHIFCDASQQAYGAVAYLRVTGWGGEVLVNIVMAKSRVAPTKCVSIPRLEMEAAIVGARMSSYIRKNLDLNIDTTYIWSDSKNVLCWIRAEDPSRFKVYISHRIGEILDLTDVGMWRWVPTADNVADDATRDNVPADVSPTSRWFNGPEFLKKSDDSWPQERQLKVDDIDPEILEMKKACCMVVTEGDYLPDMNKFGSWIRLLRVTAWMRRFVINFTAKHGKGTVKTGALTVDELKAAEIIWIKYCQESTFQTEIEELEDGKSVPRTSRLKMLSPCLVEGLLCVKSRIVNSRNIPQSAKTPVILDSKHPITKLLIAWHHRIHGHHGVELICNEIRQNYWILGLKAAVRKAAKDCLECQMEAAKIVVPEMAALPKVRVNKADRPFTYTGVDYFGPLDVVNGRKREKRYGVLFTCLSTRAVHLEMAFSLSTDDFLMALRRFVCRRGEPEELWSDNGTNFKGADKEMKNVLKEMDQSAIMDSLTIRGIKWNFIPPGSPHMGGAWERLVRSVKIAMNSILKNITLNDQLLSTVLTEAEASVNSRPLTAVSSDKDDEEAITPNCFLMGTTSIKQSAGLYNDGDLSLRKRWRHVQVLANHFWNRWLKEYLPSLALRAKWNEDRPDVVVGELVYVADSNQIRNQWTKGLVVAVYQGDGGRVRIVDVKTATGVLRRPVAKLYRVPGWKPSCDSS